MYLSNCSQYIANETTFGNVLCESHIVMCMFVCLCVCVCVYERARIRVEGEKEDRMCASVRVCVHTCV